MVIFHSKLLVHQRVGWNHQADKPSTVAPCARRAIPPKQVVEDARGCKLMMPTRQRRFQNVSKVDPWWDTWEMGQGHKWGTHGMIWYIYICVCDMNSYSAVLAVLGSNEQGPWKSVSVQLSRSVAVAGVKACKEHSRAMGRPAVWSLELWRFPQSTRGTPVSSSHHGWLRLSIETTWKNHGDPGSKP